MPTELVLFDFDGTLADTLPASFSAFKTVFKKYDDQDVTSDELVAMFGPTEDEIILNNFSNKEAVRRAVQEYYEMYSQGHNQTIEINAIIVLLQFLKERGMKIGVITGKSTRAYQISAEALNLTSYFDYVVTGNDVVHPKPHPEGVLKAIDYFGIKADKTVFLGDSNADILAGKAAGVQTFAVQWLSTFQSSVFDVKPDRTFNSTSEFIQLIEEEHDKRRNG
ncbi:HAD family hydrolase [Paenibacillus eucommiae]|uniref:Phosphoglycolate phosphatase/pyrophosphatase PpaX n=1 Tax=Paenibacillus eucommiae TaxID=1355755 RepID=A0ABS4JC55_9BACL|nr:HAD family hydrolase [Paenibacillus eucommiae]MBP1996671.1 phosphoglycolate phosphatase/pyrophosphatase PpaX [Paenibacillus eucommiae]